MADWQPPSEAFGPQTTGPAWSPPADALVGPVGTPSAPRTAQGFLEHLTAAAQGSSGGLLWRQKMPDVYADPEAPWYTRAASSVVGLIGDLPVGAAGAMSGMAIPLPGAGKLAAAGAGGFAAPAVVREALMEYFEKGTISPGKLATVAAKEATIGALTLATGGLIGRLLPEVAAGASTTMRVAGNVGRQAAIGSGELTALVGSQSVLDWRMPTSNDFIDNAVLIFGIRGAREIGVPLLRRVYERTGKTPDQVAQDAANDSTVAQDLHSGKIPHKYPKDAQPQAHVSDKFQPVRPRELLDPGPDSIRRTDYNLRHFDTPEGMADVAAIMKDEVRMEVEAARRGTMSIAQLKAGADRAGEWLGATIGEGKKTREAGQASGAEMTLAYGRLVHAGLEETRKASADLESVKAQVKEGTATKEDLEAAVAQQLLIENRTRAIVADYLGNVAEVGRSLRVVQEVAKSLGDQKKLRELMAAQPGGMVGVMNRAGIIHRAESHKAVAAVLKRSVFDKVVEYWKASILSGPTSQVVNLVSNVFFGATRVPYTFAAAMVSTARGADAVMYRQAFGESFGMVAGFVDGLSAAGRSLRDHYVTKDKQESTGKAEAEPAIGGTTGKVIRTPFALLGAMDDMAKMINGYMTAYGHAARASKGDAAKLLSPDFYRERTADVLKKVKDKDGKEHYEFVDDGELANLVTKDGLRYTFQTELPSSAKRMMAALYGTNFKFIAPFVLPFVRTPLNIYSEAIRTLPLLGAASKKQREEWAAGGERRDRAAAEHLVGAAITASVATFVAADLITGYGPADPTERRAWLLTHQPNSVRIGGQWYSYARIEPVATVLAMIADLWAVKEYVSEGEYEMAGKATAMGVRNLLTEKTFLQGISSLADLLTPDEYGGTSFSKFAGGITGGFIPNLLSQAADRIFDPQLREARSFIDRLQNRVPYVRRGLLPQRDLFGVPIRNEDWEAMAWSAMGVRVRPGTDDPVRQELARLGYAPRAITGKTADILPGPLDSKTEFSDKQYDALRTETGKMAHEMLSKIIASPGYKAAPAAYKRSIVEQTFASARQASTFGQLDADAINAAVREAANQQLQQ